MSSQRPKRAATKRVYVDEDVDNESVASGSVQAPPRKRQKPASKKPVSKKPASKKATSKKPARQKGADTEDITPPVKRRRRGLLEKINETPMDILFEIFSYLRPLDLLRISRTSKDLRAFLLNQHAEPVWRHARMSVEGLPPRPDGMSEPSYANLMFDNHCHNCLKGNSKHIEWRTRIRICRSCLDTDSIFSRYIVDSASCPERMRHIVRSLVPSYIDLASSGRRRVIYYHVESAHAIVQECKDMTWEELNDWFSTQRAIMNVQFNGTRPYARFIIEQGNDRSLELARFRQERLDDIVDNLVALGWKEELDIVDSRLTLRSHKLVNVARPLTSRTWKNIEYPLVEYMEEIRAARLKKKADSAVTRRTQMFDLIYDSFLKKQPETPVLPPTGDVTRASPFKEIINDTPLLEDISREQYESALTTHISAVGEAWRSRNLSHAKAALTTAGRSDNLDLVTSLFTCTSYCGALVYSVLSHPCARGRGHNANKTAFDLGKLRVVGDAHFQQIEEVVRLVGLDPATATRSDMEAHDVFYTCSVCSERGTLYNLHEYSMKRPPTTYAMRWHAAACHAVHVSAQDGISPLSILEEPEMIHKAKEAENKAVGQFLYNETVICVHCDVPAIYRSTSAREHLSIKHNIEFDDASNWRRALSRSISGLTDIYEIGLSAAMQAIVDAKAAAAEAQAAASALELEANIV